MKIHYLFNLITTLFHIVFIKKFLHIYQLKNYNNSRYFNFFCNKKSIFFLICFLLFVFELFFKNISFYIITNTILLIIYCIYIKNLIKSVKTPLIFTGKLSRLYIFSIFLLILFSLYEYSFALSFVAILICPVISNFLNVYDKIKNKSFIKKAKKKIEKSHAQVIAITGSNGKTSVKNILYKILSTENKVQSTPASYNTPIGIAKFINNELKKDTEYIILEYGARHKNDIKNLCKTFGADYGIVTTISAQHLESFKTIKNIYYAKKQLPIFLNNNPCIFNIDNLYTRLMFDVKQTNHIPVSINESTYISIKNYKIIENLVHFTLNIGNKSYNLKNNLLGRHNLTNICLAVSLAKLIGISNINIIKAIENLQPVEHRLQLIKTHIHIIDDSYNCSPASAKEALNVLKHFSGKKMVVTPGIIECGKAKYLINFNLGKQIAFCDYIVIVGEENKISIYNGIKKKIEENDYLQPIILFAKSLEVAKQYFTKLNNGDTLLLLNDLPDDYK